VGCGKRASWNARLRASFSKWAVDSAQPLGAAGAKGLAAPSSLVGPHVSSTDTASRHHHWTGCLGRRPVLGVHVARSTNGNVANAKWLSLLNIPVSTGTSGSEGQRGSFARFQPLWSSSILPLGTVLMLIVTVTITAAGMLLSAALEQWMRR
jgi:hypothetical protein